MGMFFGNVDEINQRFFLEANSSPSFKPLVSRLTNEIGQNTSCLA